MVSEMAGPRMLYECRDRYVAGRRSACDGALVLQSPMPRRPTSHSIGNTDGVRPKYRLVDSSTTLYRQRRGGQLHIRIERRGLDVSEELRQRLLSRIHFALAKFSGAVRSVAVRVTGAASPMGGPDWDCRVRVSTKIGSPIVIAESDSDIQAAVSRAVERAGRTIGRRLACRRFVSRSAAVRPWVVSTGERV